MPANPTAPSAALVSRRPTAKTDAGHVGMRQFWVVMLISLWIATVCNAALWRALARLPDLSTSQSITLSIALSLVIALATAALTAWAGRGLEKTDSRPPPLTLFQSRQAESFPAPSAP